jgi:hypothetical protein
MLCLTVPMAPDENEASVKALTASVGSPHVIYFAVDEDYDETWPERYGHIVRIRGFGVGRALDAATLAALRDGCDVVVRTDAHVEFKPALRPSPDALEMGYMCTPDGACFGASYPDPIDYEFRWTWRPAYVPQTAEAVISWPRALAEALIKRFGCLYCTEYWGAENYNATLTPCRLGLGCIRTGSYYAIHKYKKEWPKKRVGERAVFSREPWYRELSGENPYFTAISISYAIHIARHYRNPYVVRRLNPRALALALKYFPERARYIEGRDVFELYREMGL